MTTDLSQTLGPHPQARQIFQEMGLQYPEERRLVEATVEHYPFFQEFLPEFLHVFAALVDGFTAGRTLFLCGNGGSFADCIHMAGELMKTFKQKRPLSDAEKLPFAGLEFGDILTEHLEKGLPCLVLGLNPSLNSAVQNDTQLSAIQYAQELYALGHPGDMLLGISTSGNALNVRYAVSTAKALGMTTIGLTGKTGGKLADVVDIAIKSSETETYLIQQQHIIVYHTLCLMLESRFFSSLQQPGNHPQPLTLPQEVMSHDTP
ncbi:SIS domain-containing protein [candidate division KSB3 bacterium]|uniref:SIS domain-containing protein n=1 Tax=candidate division KSB3 bacterium TaxID=2044937 RepID=A0A9D5K0T0_9BACT|nr:SIS domain-containing protein [candidate division KSB3 bacterium]MBD3327311.1 SIS domain-containing protein [candidate division KSB3 bacterium]